jgi:hypothetical protein
VSEAKKSISISVSLECFVSPAGFFASLRMTIGGEDTPKLVAIFAEIVSGFFGRAV